MVKRIKNLVNKIFCVLGVLSPLILLIILLMMMYNNTWTITSIMQFIFLSTLYLSSTIDNAVDKILDRLKQKL